jgi:hypothetical protein
VSGSTTTGGSSTTTGGSSSTAVPAEGTRGGAVGGVRGGAEGALIERWARRRLTTSTPIPNSRTSPMRTRKIHSIAADATGRPEPQP